MESELKETAEKKAEFIAQKVKERDYEAVLSVDCYPEKHIDMRTWNLVTIELWVSEEPISVEMDTDGTLRIWHDGSMSNWIHSKEDFLEVLNDYILDEDVPQFGIEAIREHESTDQWEYENDENEHIFQYRRDDGSKLHEVKIYEIESEFGDSDSGTEILFRGDLKAQSYETPAPINSRRIYEDAIAYMKAVNIYDQERRY
jgi:hypothetical protein